MAVTSKHLQHITEFKECLHQYFDITDLGDLSWLLGLKVKRNQSKHTITLSQHAYINTILKCFHLTNEGSTILLASRTMLGECCLAAIQPKGFWIRLKAQERERVCVCVCERERGRENMKISLQTMRIRLCIRSCIVSY